MAVNPAGAATVVVDVDVEVLIIIETLVDVVVCINGQQ